jgi:hypothetical protein
VGGPSRSTAQPALGVVEVQVENVGPNAPVTPVTHHDCSFCHRLETPSFDVWYPTRILTLPTISISRTYRRIPPRTRSKQKGFDFGMKVPEMMVSDSGTIAYLRVPAVDCDDIG